MNNEYMLDQRARELHATGLANVPFSVSTQLHPREGAPNHSNIWRPVMAGAMVFALAGVGIVQLQTQSGNSQTSVAVTRATAVPPAVSPTTAMDNDPEFYAWLGSDANTLHLEK